ncbi:hypothetical protein HPB51_028330 [Rhipicephalus microplus]|uniref:Uncharacterized protein n=1 Tax=Rhipicephalus microplus TaxID=6941 RepID=A0A9J6CXY3_RHIMP|nr:hypothetical protein HPB51_028330 [Rhipicephalus microplus]
MGRSKSILITFISTTILFSSIVFNCSVYRCHPFRPKAEACINCWTPAIARTSIKPKSTLSYRCGQTNERVEPPTCDPSCILCKEDPVTGLRTCKLRFNRSGPSPASSFIQAPASGTSTTHRTHPQELPAFSPPPPVYIPLCPVFQQPPLRLFPTPAQVRGVHRPRHHSHHHHGPTTDLSVWTETILADVRTAISTLPAAPHSTTADSRLLHLWKATQRSTADGRPRNIIAACASFLARLALDMEEHCSSVLQQQWGQTCDRMAGNLGLRDTWSLLRVLLDSTHTKAP